MARTFYRRLRAARRRKDLADRAIVHLVREGGAVREASVEPLAPPLTRGSLADIPFDNARQTPRHVALRRRTRRGWTPVTSAEFAKQVTETARGLIKAGLRPG